MVCRNFISGVLCVSVNPPLLGPWGGRMLYTGGLQMGLALIDLNCEYQKRKEELKKIEMKAEKVASCNCTN